MTFLRCSSYPGALKYPLMMASEQLAFDDTYIGKRNKTCYDKLAV